MIERIREKLRRLARRYLGPCPICAEYAGIVANDAAYIARLRKISDDADTALRRSGIGPGADGRDLATRILALRASLLRTQRDLRAAQLELADAKRTDERPT